MCLVENRFSKTKTLFLKYVCDHIILKLAPITAVAEPPKLNLPSYWAHMHLPLSQRLQTAMHVHQIT
jgi:hypothetical protein